MDSGDRFSVDSARRAAARGLLAEWVTDFLASDGSDNAALAAAFAFSDAVYLGPVQLALDRLTPMAGPNEEEVVVPVAEEAWESDVEDMEQTVEEGWQPPPLLVSHRQDQLFLEDGNHRCEALRRAGEKHGWAIIAFTTEADRSAFLVGNEEIVDVAGPLD